jgi:hypothetical protein
MANTVRKWDIDLPKKVFSHEGSGEKSPFSPIYSITFFLEIRINREF